MRLSPPQRLWARFESLPATERFHIRARAFSAPLGELLAHVPPGRLLDLGCGHGLFTAWVALSRTDVQVVGLDPDSRKIALARQALQGLSQVELVEGGVDTAAERAPFDAVALLDVLYLLPRPIWPAFLVKVRGLLKPGGVFLLKEVEGDHTWRHYKGLAQEWAMVKLLGRTQTSGGLSLESRQGLRSLLEEAGFTVEKVEDLRSGYTSAHLLLIARAHPAE